MWTPGDVIAALGLGLAALTIVLGFLDRRHARSESYRAALYSAELGLISDVMTALADVHLAAKRLVLAEGADYEQALGAFDEAVRQAGIARDAGVALLRPKALRAFEADIAAVLAAVFPKGDGPQPPADRRPAIETAWTTLIAAIRAELDVDTLGDQVRELTGIAGRERADLDRQARLHRLDLEVASFRRHRTPGSDTGAPEPPASDR